jgi:glycopeptide antibiotics resistance protein
VLLASAAAAPVVAVLALLRARRAGRYGVTEVLLVAGTVPWLWMILTPDPAGSRRLNLVPLRDLLTLAPGEVVVQVGGNLLVFAALGAALPVRWRATSTTVAIVAAAASIGVETLQYAVDLGRVSSIDDVLMNTLGAVLAAQTTRGWWRSHSGDDEVARAPVR